MYRINCAYMLHRLCSAERPCTHPRIRGDAASRAGDVTRACQSGVTRLCVRAWMGWMGWKKAGGAHAYRSTKDTRSAALPVLLRVDPGVRQGLYSPLAFSELGTQ